MRKEHPVFGAVALGIGAFVLLDVLGRFLNNDMLFNLGALGMTLFPIWAFCFGIDLLRKPERVKASIVP